MPIREVLDAVAALQGTRLPVGAPQTHERLPLLALGGKPEVPPENRSGARSDQQLVNLWLGSKRSTHTRRAYARDFAALDAFLAALPARDGDATPGRPWGLSEVTVRHLDAFCKHLEGDPESAPRTVCRRMSAAKSLFTFGHQTGYLRYNVGSVVKLMPFAHDLAQRILSEADVHACIAAARVGRDRSLLRFLYASGCRVSEAIALRWEHLSPRDDRLLVTVRGKGGKTRVVPLPLRFRAELEQLEHNNMSGHIFESRGGRPLDSKTMWSITHTAARQAGIKCDVSPHFLRHSHASHAIRRGAKIHVVQQTLGHASVQTTGAYLHLELGESSAFFLDT